MKEDKKEFIATIIACIVVIIIDVICLPLFLINSITNFLERSKLWKKI